MARENIMKKGKKKRKSKKTALTAIKKFTGPLTDDRLGCILWGAYSHRTYEPLYQHKDNDNTIVKPLSWTSKTFSNILQDRVHTPITGDCVPAMAPEAHSLNFKGKSFSEIVRDAKNKSKLRQATISTAMSEKQTTGKEKNLGDLKTTILSRIQRKINDTDAALDLIGLSNEMHLLRELLIGGGINDIPPDQLELIERDAELIGKHAHQAQLLDRTQDGVGFAKHLRSIWEVLYFRACGMQLPIIDYGFENEEEEEELILKDAASGIGQMCSDEESESEEEDDEEETEVQSIINDSLVEPQEIKDEDEAEITPTWTFTSESVEDYLRRRNQSKAVDSVDGELKEEPLEERSNGEYEEKIVNEEIHEIVPEGIRSEIDSVCSEKEEYEEEHDSITELEQHRHRPSHVDAEESNDWTSVPPATTSSGSMRLRGSFRSPRSTGPLPVFFLDEPTAEKDSGQTALQSSDHFSSLEHQVHNHSPTRGIMRRLMRLHSEHAQEVCDASNEEQEIAGRAFSSQPSKRSSKVGILSRHRSVQSAPTHTLTLDGTLCEESKGSSPPSISTDKVGSVSSLDSSDVSSPLKMRVAVRVVERSRSGVEMENSVSQGTNGDTQPSIALQHSQELSVHMNAMAASVIPPRKITVVGDTARNIEIFQPSSIEKSSFHIAAVLPFDSAAVNSIRRKDTSYVPPLMTRPAAEFDKRRQPSSVPEPTVTLASSSSPPPRVPAPPLIADSVGIDKRQSKFSALSSFAEGVEERSVTAPQSVHTTDSEGMRIFPRAAPMSAGFKALGYGIADDFFGSFENSTIPRDESRSLSLGTNVVSQDQQLPSPPKRNSSVQVSRESAFKGTANVDKGSNTMFVAGIAASNIDKMPPPVETAHSDTNDNGAADTLKPYEIKLQHRVGTAKLRKMFVNYPIHTKGDDYNEFYYEERDKKFHFQCIREGTITHSVNLPLDEVIATQSSFEGMLTLRCCSNDVPDDYLATIPFDDWKTILHQERINRKRCRVSKSEHVNAPDSESEPSKFYSSEYENSSEREGIVTLHSYTQPPVLQPTEFSESELSKQFDFIAGENTSEEKDADVFITGLLSNVPHSNANKGVKCSPQHMDYGLPPRKVRDIPNSEKIKEMRKIYRKYKPRSSYHVVDVMSDKASAIDGIHPPGNRPLQECATDDTRSTKPPILVDDDDVMCMAKGGDSEINSCHNKQEDDEKTTTHACDSVSDSDDLDMTIRPGTETTSADRYGSLRHIKRRPMTTGIAGNKESLAGKLMHIDVTPCRKDIPGNSLVPTTPATAQSRRNPIRSQHIRPAVSGAGVAGTSENIPASTVARRPVTQSRTHRSPRARRHKARPPRPAPSDNLENAVVGVNVVIPRVESGGKSIEPPRNASPVDLALHSVSTILTDFKIT